MSQPGDLFLTPPEPVAVVPAEKAETMIPLDDATREALARRARTYVDELAGLDPRTPEFTAKIGQVAGLGDGEIRASAQAANRMLNRSVAALAGARGDTADAQKRVAGGLVELRRTVEDLDPKDIGKVTGRRLVSKLPFGRSLRDFVSRYQSANVTINKIVIALRSGQDELRRDNAAIQNERAALWATMGKLQEYAVLASALDGAVERKIAETADEQRADALRADCCSPFGKSTRTS